MSTTENTTSRPIVPVRDLLELLPYAQRIGGTLVLRDLDEETLRTLSSRADEINSSALSGIRAIGEMLFWLSRVDDPPGPEVISGAGEAIQTLAELLESVKEIQNAINYAEKLPKGYRDNA